MFLLAVLQGEVEAAALVRRMEQLLAASTRAATTATGAPPVTGPYLFSAAAYILPT